MTILSHLLIGFGLSFIGSLPFGIINMTVAHTAIRKGVSRALWMAFGAVLVEFVQVFIALKFTWLFTGSAGIERIMQAVAAAVFLVAGIYFFFFAKAKPPAEKAETTGRRRHEFGKGVFVSTLNVMAIPYWIFYGAVLTSNDLLDLRNVYVLVFATGTALGTFALLVAYALLGARILRKSEQITRWVNKFIGVVLLGFAVYEAWQVVF
ncbi:MAG: LysE family translocator [Saprospiraceae bacterium]